MCRFFDTVTDNGLSMTCRLNTEIKDAPGIVTTNRRVCELRLKVQLKLRLFIFSIQSPGKRWENELTSKTVDLLDFSVRNLAAKPYL